VEKIELLHDVGRNVNYYSYYGKTVWRILKKLKIKLPYDPAISLLSTCSKEMKSIFTQESAHPCLLQQYSQ
jgi:hypothetical protein